MPFRYIGDYAPLSTSVNDRILLMSDSQDSILRHSFTQHIPKSISDKVNFLLDDNKGGNYNGGGKFNGRQNQGNETNRSKPDLVSDNDKNHSKWRFKESKDFAKIFYKNQHKCPKMSDGKSICMKFFIWGYCDKSCTRVCDYNSWSPR